MNATSSPASTTNKAPSTQASALRVSTVQNRYRHNLARHLLGTAHYLQTNMMQRLQADCGHQNLRLGFAPYITLIGERDMRPSDLAQTLSISRQACNQAVKHVEAAGYLKRAADPLDGRATLLTLSPQGYKLRRDGVRIVAQLDEQFALITGQDAIEDARLCLEKIVRQLALGLQHEPDASEQNPAMGGLLPRLSDYILLRLRDLTIARGHPGLKLSFAQVLTLIGPNGGRMQQMAAIHDVSKQAINVTVGELETLGYLRREPDPLDARQVVLRFSKKGDALITDSVASTDQLETEFADIVGQPALERLGKTLQALYHGLDLEQGIFEQPQTNDLHLLAGQLKQQLGPQRSTALATLLLQATE